MPMTRCPRNTAEKIAYHESEHPSSFETPPKSRAHNLVYRHRSFLAGGQLPDRRPVFHNRCSAPVGGPRSPLWKSGP